jgi:hypothetical protein
MPLTPELKDFVRAAVRLPEYRLKAVDQAWDKLYPHRAVITDLAQRSEGVLSDLIALREYVLAEARRVVIERPEERLIPEDILDAVLPAARALLLRNLLENSPDGERAQAFAALTAPFADLLPQT